MGKARTLLQRVYSLIILFSQILKLDNPKVCVTLRLVCDEELLSVY